MPEYTEEQLEFMRKQVLRGIERILTGTSGDVRVREEGPYHWVASADEDDEPDSGSATKSSTPVESVECAEDISSASG